MAKINTGLSTSDATVLKQGRANIFLASIYLPFDSPTLPPTSDLMKLVEEAQRKNKKIVIVCDANSHHEAWQLFNRARLKMTEVYWDEYHNKLGEYKNIVRKAKRDSWKLFCEQGNLAMRHLSPILLKTLERIVDSMVKSSIPYKDLKYKQHAYVRGRSVETALNEVVYYIGESFDSKLYTLAPPRTLTEKGLRPVCYADDVVILLKGKDLNYLCRRAAEALSWAQPRGLNLRRRTKISTYTEPCFLGKKLPVTDKVKTRHQCILDTLEGYTHSSDVPDRIPDTEYVESQKAI
ncbi:hypothetical protein FF38_12922 [Lucilia cuprina]|uniref:Reverse transcriptase domain-containing protein n=1 Tax=Lucilia cuprina TaxID=7375 RepID=A0A0L0CIP7_LUCCU|nr:hypothetical protein FF38_12922 [Lucilia cuprina]